MTPVERGGLARLPRFRFFQPGSKNLPYEHFSPVTRINESRMDSSQQRMRSMVDEVAGTRPQDFGLFSSEKPGDIEAKLVPVTGLT